MFGVKAKITRCLDDTGYPPFVQCEFIDAHGKVQIFNDKDAIFTTQNLDRNSDYPQAVIIGCEIVERTNSTVKINTEMPWHIESISGETFFEIESEQLIEFEHLGE
jgi:hypothetical protein